MTTLQRIARISLIPLSTLLAGIAHAQSAKEIVSTSGEREATAITVYNDDLALVKERRKIALPSGLARLSLREVSAKMRPETALRRAVSGRPISLIVQSFDFLLHEPISLLEHYVC